MSAVTINTRFCRKTLDVQKLQYNINTKPFRIEVAKIIELTQKQYQHFSSHLLENMPFIAANRGLMREVDGVQHCLLVHDRNRQDGILVQSEGFLYARYAAYVPDKSALDLRDVAVERCNQQLRKKRSGQER